MSATAVLVSAGLAAAQPEVPKPSLAWTDLGRGIHACADAEGEIVGWAVVTRRGSFEAQDEEKDPLGEYVSAEHAMRAVEKWIEETQ